MKKILFILITSLGALNNVVHSDQIITEFDSPFQIFNLDTKVWSQEKSSNRVQFIHFGDEGFECALEIYRGDLLKEDSLFELKKQIYNNKGDLKKVSLLKFPSSDDLKDSEKMQESVKVIMEDFVDVTVNGIHGISGEIEYYPVRGQIRHFVYLFIIENKFYVIRFSALREKFIELKPLFEETMQNLFTNSQNK